MFMHSVLRMRIHPSLGIWQLDRCNDIAGSAHTYRVPAPKLTGLLVLTLTGFVPVHLFDEILKLDENSNTYLNSVNVRPIVTGKWQRGASAPRSSRAGIDWDLENESWDLFGCQFSFPTSRITMKFQVSVVGVTTGCSLIVLFLSSVSWF